MNTINSKNLLNALGPTAIPANTPTVANTETVSVEGAFLNILQSFATALGTQTSLPTEAIDVKQPSSNWLATLMSILNPNNIPSLTTPDPSGEASLETAAAINIPLSEIMAAVQAIVAPGAGSQTVEQAAIQSLLKLSNTTNPVDNASDDTATENTLALIAAEMGLMQPTAHLPSVPAPHTTSTAAEADASTATAAILQNAILSGAHTTPATPTDAALTGQGSVPTGTAPPANTGNTPATIDTTAAPQTTTAPGQQPNPSTPDLAVNSTAVADSATQNSASTAQPAAAGNTFAQLLTNTSDSAPSPTAANVNPAATVVQQKVDPTTQQLTATPNKPETPTEATAVAGQVVAPAHTPSTAPPVVAAARAEAPLNPNQPALPNVPALRQIVNSVSLLNGNGQTAVRLQLHPESLGQVLVQLHVNNGNVTVQMLAESAKAQTLIQNHLPQLKSAFAAQGLGNGSFDVAVGSDASAFNAPHQQTFGWQNAPSRHAPSGLAIDNIAATGEQQPVTHARPTSGRIDYHI